MNGISITVAPKERNFWESALAWWRARPTSIRVLPSGLLDALARQILVRGDAISAVEKANEVKMRESGVAGNLVNT